MSPRVKNFLEGARGALNDAMSEPAGPRQVEMKRHFRSRARIYVKAARISHSMDIRAALGKELGL
jgi:hypothetical protein